MKTITIKMQVNSLQYGRVSVCTTHRNMSNHINLYTCNHINLYMYNHKKIGCELSYITPLFDGPIIIHYLLLKHLQWRFTTRKTTL
jgi:hypothetical protein